MSKDRECKEVVRILYKTTTLLKHLFHKQRTHAFTPLFYTFTKIKKGQSVTLENLKLSIFLGVALMLLHFSSLKKSEKSSLWTLLFIFIGSFIFVTTLSYLFSLYENSVIKANRGVFYDEHPLICKAGAPQKKHHYLVSIKEGWSVYENSYFKKDDLLLEIINCESNQ